MSTEQAKRTRRIIRKAFGPEAIAVLTALQSQVAVLEGQMQTVGANQINLNERLEALERREGTHG